MQLTATPCNTLQHNTVPYSATHRDATHCNKLQHTATSCNTPAILRKVSRRERRGMPSIVSAQMLKARYIYIYIYIYVKKRGKKQNGKRGQEKRRKKKGKERGKKEKVSIILW